MKRIRQFRYYNNPSDNSPRTGLDFQNGNWFESIGPVSHLGVQATPGTRFYLNGSTQTISVGHTGIYEIDLGDLGVIQSFKLDMSSVDLNSIQKTGIIVDVIYEGA